MAGLLPRSVFLLPLACLFASPCSAGASDERPCSGPVLLLDADIDPAWQTAVSELKGHLTAFPDVDRCATVRIFAAAPGVLVEVELADGRAAIRRVEDEDMLAFVIQSLVTRIPVPEAQELPAQASASVRAAQGASPAPEARGTRRAFEFGLAASTRFAERPNYLGYGMALHADVVFEHWLVGSWIRWDFRDVPVHAQNAPRDLVMSSFLWGGFAGRRFGLGRSALDLTAGFSLMIENQEAFEGTPEDTGGAFADVTLGAAVRFLGPASGGPG
ncbi:MAG TPA: hypothetical protein VG963_27585, partial [Polyangiaceae bacterium]|nr:hypothetical protein [Polyangiaceae bacterium]